MPSYGQFCPVAKAMEVLDERWTMLVIRELLEGSRRFNDLRRGLPRMSPALLSKRLASLTRVGVVQHRTEGDHSCYSLTDAGLELAGVIDSLGAWGVRWIPVLGDADLDPHLLMWDIRRKIPLEAWPTVRTTVAFELSGVPPKSARWWLVVDGGSADICDADPGHEVAALVLADLRTLTRIWRGDIDWGPALRDGTVRLSGPAANCRQIPDWLGQSRAALIPRP